MQAGRRSACKDDRMGKDDVVEQHAHEGCTSCSGGTHDADAPATPQDSEPQHAHFILGWLGYEVAETPTLLSVLLRFSRQCFLRYAPMIVLGLCVIFYASGETLLLEDRFSSMEQILKYKEQNSESVSVGGTNADRMVVDPLTGGAFSKLFPGMVNALAFLLEASNGVADSAVLALHSIGTPYLFVSPAAVESIVHVLLYGAFLLPLILLLIGAILTMAESVVSRVFVFALALPTVAFSFPLVLVYVVGVIAFIVLALPVYVLTGEKKKGKQNDKQNGKRSEKSSKSSKRSSDSEEIQSPAVASASGSGKSRRRKEL